MNAGTEHTPRYVRAMDLHTRTQGCDDIRGDGSRYCEAVYLAVDYATLSAHNRELVAALEHFAEFPLEDFGWDDKKHDHPITGFNNWKLNVGHIKAVRAALALSRGQP